MALHRFPLPRFWTLWVAGLVAVLIGVAGSASAAEPRDPAAVAHEIDRLIQAKLDAVKVSASPLADDAEFARRVTLDITGRVPDYDAIVAFLDARGADKRRQLIDALLADQNYGEHLANQWRDLVVREDVDKFQVRYIAPFRNWLARRFNANPGWDELATELLTAEGEVAEKPQGMYVLSSMNMGQPDAGKQAAIASRLFLGLDLECAQCHDHPYVNEWKHHDFWRFAAFFGHVRDDGPVGNAGNTSKRPLITEANGPSKGSDNDRKPYYAAPDGAVIDIPDPKDSDKFLELVPARFLGNSADVPIESLPLRPHLAQWITSADNPYFARAAVNRMWYHLFTRGLVDPVDAMHPNNPPSHPELLELLSAEFAASGYDLKHLIRSIALSQTYQRTSRPLPENEQDRTLFSHMAVKVLTPDALKASLEVAFAKLGNANDNRFNQLFERSSDPRELAYGVPHYLRLLNTTRGESKGRSRSVEELFLRTLARRPTPGELERLANVPDNVVWSALLNSAEFIHNH